MAESGVQLTTSRVNRLLRPLRNKCISLATLPKTAAVASRVTYSMQSSNWHPDDHPPLSILYFSTTTKKLTLDGRSADKFELSRRIHAVCDAFKNIAHAAFGRPCLERVPSLAAMCALAVSENMPAINTLAVSGEGTTDDILDVDSIYETVPPHYRRFLIVSHALSMILCICAHHHTLVTILFDHCLSFGLVHESTRLLNIILTQAFLSSNPSYPPPATHPGHINYLLDLHTKWTSGNRPSGTSSDTPLFTTSAFCRVLLNTLSQSSSGHSLWTSKVLNRLLHVVGGCDIDSYICVIRALTQSFWETSGSSPETVRDDGQLAMLREKLSELMSNLFDLLFTQHGSHPPPLIPSRIYTAIDMVHDCHSARLHLLRTSTPGSYIDLPDVIITFAVHIFVAFRNSVDNFDRLVAILDDSSPIPSTFSKLMLYFSRFQEDQAFDNFAEVFLSELKAYSSALRSVKLFRLDASLWACALRHFETLTMTSQKASSALVTRYKRQLMEAVDAAERRCFGGDCSPVVSTAHTIATRARRTHCPRTSGHWEWEDMVGSWIRRTPISKKRKIDVSCLHAPLRHSNSRPWGTMTSKVISSAPVTMPISNPHRRSSTFSPSSSYSQFSDPEFPTDDGSEYQEETDKENYFSSPQRAVKGTHRIKRRSSNFFSLIADAQMHRVVLHSSACSESKPPSSAIPEKYVLPSPSRVSAHAPRRQEQNICRKTPPRPRPPETMLPSDDSLNLFAYASSSPVRC